MPVGDSPTVARRRLRLALREAREAANLTQQQVADEMEWSLSKVIRIESGDVSIAPNDLRPLLSYFGVKDRDYITMMLQDAKIARTRHQRAWWQEPAYREHLTAPLQRLIEYEAEASAVRYYSIYYMPGPLQTPEYAAALMELWSEELSADQIDARLKVRRLRREALLSRAGKVKLWLLLDESVFMRPLGGEAVFAIQLRELHRLASEGLASIAMIPFSLNAPITNNASFDLLSLDGNDEGMVLYHESGLSDELVEDRAATLRHLGRYEKIWKIATSEADTIDFIFGRIKYLEAMTDRRGQPQ